MVAETIVDQTVSFHDDRVVDHNVFPDMTPIKDSLLRSVKENREHSIKDFLGRPVVFSTGVITTT